MATIITDGKGAKARLLTPAQVGEMLVVDPRTVTRWARDGKLRCIRTPGGHRRYDAEQVEGFLNDWSGE
jgi:excisionase family DNA binding protein